VQKFFGSFFKKEHAFFAYQIATSLAIEASQEDEGSMEQPAGFIALNRFGLGARPGDLALVSGAPRGWVLAQLERGHVDLVAGVAETPPRFHALATYLKARDEANHAEAAAVAAQQQAPRPAPACPLPPAFKLPPQLENLPGRTFQADRIKRIEQMVASETPVLERLVAFWSNHFTVSVTRDEVTVCAVPYENEAIRPFLFASFGDMLEATATHPAMAFYLDSVVSMGPDSPTGRRRKKSVNENYAREVMELHTLGVNGGYTQGDVQELALAFTGFGMDQQEGESVWFYDRHEPGERVLLGRRLAEGDGQARAALALLADHPSTIRHVCTKLAAHFCGDVPPASVVRRMAEAWRASHGRLPALYAVLANAPEAWVERPVKFRTPQDFVVASARALQLHGHGEQMLGELAALGHLPFKAPSPAGYSDKEADWMDPAGALGRVRAAQHLAALAGSGLDAAGVLPQLIHIGSGSATLDVVLAEPDPASAMALVLASPEFQRR
jgi:uncharacterized protein (DUF1800 family)